MAAGFGNAGSFTHASLAAAVEGNAQQITGPGWTAAVGDITNINATDSQLRTKVISGHLDPQPVTVNFFMDPATQASPTATTTGTLLLDYPGAQTGTFSMNAGMTAFKWGDMIEDDIMVGECEFMLTGGAVLDDTS